MPKLVVTKNPFEPDNGRKITEYSGTIGGLRAWLDDKEVNIVVDDCLVPDDYVPKENQIICVYPIIGGGGGGKSGGKGLVTLVAAVALAYVSMGTVSFLAGNGFWAMSMAHATAWCYLGGAAVMFIGGRLINRMTATATDVGNYDYNNNPTYSWGDPQTMEGQNNPIAKTYGKVKSAGQTLGKYISYDSDGNEVLNWLVGGGEGEISFSNIKLNDNLISNYSGITYETRSGINEQSVISNFNDTYFTTMLGYSLEGTTWRTNEVQGNATQGIIVKIECPGGLYYANDDGSLGNAWIIVVIQYKLHSESTWTHGWRDAIHGAENVAIRKEYRLDNLEAGKYDVRVHVESRSDSESSTRACVKANWNSVTSIVYDDFSYPCIGLIGIRGIATSQLSGSPTLSFIKERSKVWVWNPNNNTYEQKNANNPAWASYDMLHCCHRLKNINTGSYEYVIEGVPASQIIFSQFNEWAVWCEENNLHINIEINSTGEMLDIINNKIACIGRGIVLRFGTRYGVKWSHVQTPVQMFGMGNIIKDSFKETFLSKTDRANCVEVTFTDAEREYERRTITVFGNSYNTDPVANPSQITYDGITSYEQAYREGKYLMECNERLLRTVSFDADIDSIACTVGDVVIVSHDVPQWSHSGRIESVDTTGGQVVVSLPSIDSPLIGHNWHLRWRNDSTDNIYEESVTISFDNEIIQATFAHIPSVLPNKDEIFDLAIINESRGLFTIQSITCSSKFRRHIEALQYDENVYSEQYEIPSIIYTREDTTAVNVTDLQAKQVAYTKSDGSKASRMFVSWNMAKNGGQYNVYSSTDGKTWKIETQRTSLTNAKFDVEPHTTYHVKVVTVLGASQSHGLVCYPVYPGNDVLPPNVTELNCEVISGGIRRYYWKFDYPDPNDIAGFRIKYMQGTDTTWTKANSVQDGLIMEQPFETTTVRQGAHTVMIKAVDNAGQESGLPAICYVDFGDLLEENVLFKVNHHENNWHDVVGGLEHWESEETSYWGVSTDPRWMSIKNGYIDNRGQIRPKEVSSYWEQEQTEFWKTTTTPHWQPLYLPLEATFGFTALASGYWWMKYEYTGAATVWYKINNDGIYKQYSTRVRVEAGDRISIMFTTEQTDAAIISCTSIIDVPDREEHFSNVTVPTEGVQLDIQTPNYYTTAVRIDSLPIIDGVVAYPQIWSRNPCILRLVSADGTALSATATHITWQGFEKEVLENE